MRVYLTERIAQPTLLHETDQAHVAAKINELVQNVGQFRAFQIAHPILTSRQYTESVHRLHFLESSIEKIAESDFKIISKPKILETIHHYQEILDQMNPDAWKTDWIARAILISALTGIFAYSGGWIGMKEGLIGSGCALAIEKSIINLIKQSTGVGAEQKRTPSAV